MEGLVDHNIQVNECVCNKDVQNRIIMFAGNISRTNGIDILVQGFLKSKLIGVELHIYGSGDYKEELEK
ncbi:hypothetical protein CIY_27350 [Butyrivibrio fibrisolvens 16/4]|nr:hypothetical protein CIY_27350 [Butyrivibrio fibrisolvens 16/4]